MRQILAIAVLLLASATPPALAQAFDQPGLYRCESSYELFSTAPRVGLFADQSGAFRGATVEADFFGMFVDDLTPLPAPFTADGAGSSLPELIVRGHFTGVLNEQANGDPLAKGSIDFSLTGLEIRVPRFQTSKRLQDVVQQVDVSVFTPGYVSTHTFDWPSFKYANGETGYELKLTLYSDDVWAQRPRDNSAHARMGSGLEVLRKAVLDGRGITVAVIDSKTKAVLVTASGKSFHGKSFAAAVGPQIESARANYRTRSCNRRFPEGPVPLFSFGLF